MADGASNEAKRLVELARGEDLPMRSEVADAIELLELAPHDVPDGRVGFQGHAFVALTERLLKRLTHHPSAEEAEALAVLLIWAAAGAREAAEKKARDDAYDFGPAVSGVGP